MILIVAKIVPKASATLDRYTSIGIHANHMDMTKFSSDQDPDYQNILSELQRFTNPRSSPHQLKEALNLASAGTEERNQGYSAGEQDQAAAHATASPKQPTRLVNTFSGSFNTGGGKMIQGGEFNSGGGPISF